MITQPWKFPRCPPIVSSTGQKVTLDDLLSSQDANGKLPPDPKFDRVDPFGMYAGYNLVTPETHKTCPLYLPDPEREFCGLSKFPEYTTQNPRPVEIVFIGGGMAGINFTISAQWNLKNAKFRIYEKNPEVGGGSGCARGELRMCLKSEFSCLIRPLLSFVVFGFP